MDTSTLLPNRLTLKPWFGEMPRHHGVVIGDCCLRYPPHHCRRSLEVGGGLKRQLNRDSCQDPQFLLMWDGRHLYPNQHDKTHKESQQETAPKITILTSIGRVVVGHGRCCACIICIGRGLSSGRGMDGRTPQQGLAINQSR